MIEINRMNYIVKLLNKSNAKIKKGLESGRLSGGVFVNEDMVKLGGKLAPIIEMYYNDNWCADMFIILAENDKEYYFSKNMIDCIVLNDTVKQGMLLDE